MDAENFPKQFEILLKWILNQVNHLKTMLRKTDCREKLLYGNEPLNKIWICFLDLAMRISGILSAEHTN